MAERPDLTDAMVAEIIARDERWQVHALALNPWLCHKFRMLLALHRDPDSAVRAKLAAREDLPPDVVDVLTHDPSPVVRLAVFARRDTPEAVRAAIHADVTENAPTLDDLIAADDEYGLVFDYLQAYSTLSTLRPEWVTAEAANHVTSPYPCFRIAAALSPELPLEAIRALLDDEDEHVRITMVNTVPHLVDASRAERIERMHHWDKFTMWWEYQPVLTHSPETMRRFATDPEHKPAPHKPQPEPLPLPTRLQPSRHQPHLISEHHSLHPIPQLQLRQNPADVRLHRRLRQVQRLGDLSVRLPARDLDQHLALAIGQPPQPLVGSRSGRRGRVGLTREGLDELPGDARRHHPIPRGHRPDPGDEVGRVRILEQESRRTGP